MLKRHCRTLARTASFDPATHSQSGVGRFPYPRQIRRPVTHQATATVRLPARSPASRPCASPPNSEHLPGKWGTVSTANGLGNRSRPIRTLREGPRVRLASARDWVKMDYLANMEMYDREGRPLDLRSWAQLNADPDYKFIGHDKVGVYTISTVWLGMDHNFTSAGPPVTFETMVFYTESDAVDYSLSFDTLRYCTEAEAAAGHQEMVALVRATTVTDPVQSLGHATPPPA